MNFHCLTLAFLSSLLRINCPPTPMYLAISNLSIWLNTPAVHRHFYAIPKFFQLRNTKCQRLIPFWPFYSKPQHFFCVFLLCNFHFFPTILQIDRLVVFFLVYPLHWHLISWDNSIGRIQRHALFTPIKSFLSRFVVKLNTFFVFRWHVVSRSSIVMKNTWFLFRTTNNVLQIGDYIWNTLELWRVRNVKCCFYIKLYCARTHREREKKAGTLMTHTTMLMHGAIFLVALFSAHYRMTFVSLILLRMVFFLSLLFALKIRMADRINELPRERDWFFTVWRMNGLLFDGATK